MCGNFSSFTTPSPGQVSIPNSFVSLLVFYILSYLLLKRMDCLSACLVSSASVQKLFCWKLLSVQIIFSCICGGESSLPILFLCHLGTDLHYCFLTAFPLFLHSLTSLISNCFSLFFGTQGRLRGPKPFSTNKKQGRQRGFCAQEGPACFYSVSNPPFLVYSSILRRS